MIKNVVLCKDCKYKVERHYEEKGEKPYVKITCGNFRGLNQKYQVSEFDFCSRGEQENKQ